MVMQNSMLEPVLVCLTGAGIAFAVAGCGIEVTPKKLTVEGTVYHSISLDDALLRAYFEQSCEQSENPPECLSEKLTEFYSALGFAGAF